ncbi:hypothetical protein BK126_14080 [Paenibacillus sp. FSL H7-0326]|nr:hypothetical protein BK126_14080 [Paenibacillus sp. FSL H7-0326]
MERLTFAKQPERGSQKMERLKQPERGGQKIERQNRASKWSTNALSYAPSPRIPIQCITRHTKLQMNMP